MTETTTICYQETAKALRVDDILEHIFDKYDQDRSDGLSKFEFPMVVKDIFNLFHADTPSKQDISDLFNMLDINGDQRISRSQLKVLIEKFLKTVSDHKPY